jgi:BlaI family transcriptional regulator, penicillinase repressor
MAKRSNEPRIELGEAELAVLRVLWEHGPSTVRDVLNQLHERGKKVAYTTVLTFLSRLEHKGVVASDKNDQAYVYRPKVSRESVSQSRVRVLLDQLYDGAAGPMVLQLVEQERLTASELAQLRRLINDLDDAGPGKPGVRGPSEGGRLSA